MNERSAEVSENDFVESVISKLEKRRLRKFELMLLFMASAQQNLIAHELQNMGLTGMASLQLSSECCTKAEG